MVKFRNYPDDIIDVSGLTLDQGIRNISDILVDNNSGKYNEMSPVYLGDPDKSELELYEIVSKIIRETVKGENDKKTRSINIGYDDVFEIDGEIVPFIILTVSHPLLNVTKGKLNVPIWVLKYDHVVMQTSIPASTDIIEYISTELCPRYGQMSLKAKTIVRDIMNWFGALL